jgi:chromosome segregation ATPase
MADIKATSFRVSEEDLDKFKQFMEQEGIKTQADGFKSIMQSVEMAKAKNLITGRGKEIETFQETINNLMGYFLNSLNVNQTSEERIREELSKELNTKDNTISTMYEQLQELKADKINSDNNIKEIESKNKELQEQLQKANTDNVEKSKSLDVANRNNNTLQEQLAEYKQYKDNYKTIEKDLEQLKADNTMLDNSNKQSKDKLTNNADMLTFYKENISKLESNIDAYKADMKALEETHKQDVAEAKVEHQKALEGQHVALQEQYNSKMDVEVSKKDLEIERLQNQIEQLKAEKAKQQHKPKATKSENL